MNTLNYSYEYAKNNIQPFEMWMLFSTGLATYIKQHNRTLKIYISLPERELFLPFFVFGCIDYDIRSEKSVFDQQRISSLDEGDTVYYLEDGQWQSMRFISIKENETEGQEIELKDFGRTSRIVPQHLWDMFLRIPNKQKITFDLKHLKKVYGKDCIDNVTSIGAPLTYISTVKKKWYETIEDINFYISGEYVPGKELFKSETTTYNNITFLNARQTTKVSPVLQSVIVCDGTLKILNHMSDVNYSKSKQIYILDRMESAERIELVQHNFQSMVLEEGLQNKNMEFLQYADSLNITIPQGVELFIAAYDK